MELLKKVTSLEAKRCYVLSQRFTSKKMRKEELKKHIIKPIKETFLKNLSINKHAVLKLEETELDRIISAEYKKRLRAYDSVKWYIGHIDLSEAGLWKGAGGLPKAWTRGSLKDSADKMSYELKENNPRYSRIRAMKTVPEIVNFKAIIKKEKYLLPIILSGGTISSSRKGMRKMKGDIDDGCMRSLAFAISGDKKIKAYIGIKFSKK
jgi:hypothetical protein